MRCCGWIVKGIAVAEFKVRVLGWVSGCAALSVRGVAPRVSEIQCDTKLSVLKFGTAKNGAFLSG